MAAPGIARPKAPPRVTRPRRSERGSRAASSLPFPIRAAAFVAALPDQRWLDRIVRGRAWIPVLGVLLVGIVAMQVEVLKLGAGIGRSMSLATELQSRNQLLQADVARLGDVERIERMALGYGMTMPGPTEVGFLPAAGAGAVHRAIRGITAPSPTTFLQNLQAARTAASGATTATANAAQAAAAAANLTSLAPALSGSATTVAPVSSTGATGASTGATGGGQSPTAPVGSPVTGAPATAGTPAASAPTVAPASTTPPAAAPSGVGTTAPTGAAIAGSSGAPGGTSGGVGIPAAG